MDGRGKMPMIHHRLSTGETCVIGRQGPGGQDRGWWSGYRVGCSPCKLSRPLASFASSNSCSSDLGNGGSSFDSARRLLATTPLRRHGLLRLLLYKVEACRIGLVPFLAKYAAVQDPCLTPDCSPVLAWAGQPGQGISTLIPGAKR